MAFGNWNWVNDKTLTINLKYEHESVICIYEFDTLFSPLSPFATYLFHILSML